MKSSMIISVVIIVLSNNHFHLLWKRRFND